MTRSKHTAIALAFICLLSCSDQKGENKTADDVSDNKTTNTSSSNAGGENVIRFKVDGADVSSAGWNIARFDLGKGEMLNITSDMHKEKRAINVNLNGVGEGTYKLGPINMGDKMTGYGTYYPDYNDPLSAMSIIDGEVTITKMDQKDGVVDGTFKATVEKDGKKIAITDGQIINGKLKPDVQRVPQ